MPITDAGNGQFVWTDENGSEVAWRTVGTFADGLVWYATGKVKAAARDPVRAGEGGRGADAPAEGREGRRRRVQHQRANLHGSDSRARRRRCV